MDAFQACHVAWVIEFESDPKLIELSQYQWDVRYVLMLPLLSYLIVLLVLSQMLK